jgi:glutaminyl-tRNA synthetase
MPTLAGLRRRGYTPEALQACSANAAAPPSRAAGSTTPRLEAALRDTLDPIAPRAMAVLDPVKLVITDWAELMGRDAAARRLHGPDPPAPSRRRQAPPSSWAARSGSSAPTTRTCSPRASSACSPATRCGSSTATPSICTGATRDADGKLVEVQATLVPDTKSGTPGRRRGQGQGLHHLGRRGRRGAGRGAASTSGCSPTPHPGSGELLEELNRHSLEVCAAYVEPSLADAKPEAAFQFERHGYFVLDAKAAAAGQRVFNRAAGMRDSWGK